MASEDIQRFAPYLQSLTRLTMGVFVTWDHTDNRLQYDVADLIRDVPREATQGRSNVGFSEAFNIISTALTFVNREIIKERSLKIRE
jgi:hypothetical protein